MQAIDFLVLKHRGMFWGKNQAAQKPLVKSNGCFSFKINGHTNSGSLTFSARLQLSLLNKYPIIHWIGF